MEFLKELSKLVNKLPNAKARVQYLEDLLKKEKNKEKRKDIKKVLANAKSELKKEQKKEKPKIISLEDELKAPIMISTPTNTEDYIVLPTNTTQLTTNFKEEKEIKEKSYTEKLDSNYVPKKNTDELSTYVRDEENQAYLERMGNIWSSSSNPKEEINTTSKTYEREKESEEYKREEQLKDMISEDLKRKKEEEEYKRKKMV